MSKTEQVAHLRLAGASHMEIAERLGISISSVPRHIQKARAAGLLPPKTEGRPATKVNEELKRHGMRRGSIQEALETLTPEARHWLMALAPEGTTIAGMLAAIATDAYNEEMGG